MRPKELSDLLSLLARSANAAAKKHGVHYYEHERNNQWRPCPESFAVHSAFDAVRSAGYGVAAEANQGGVWSLGKCAHDVPEGGARRRYDLVIWPKRVSRKIPLALCEFKSLFGKQSFRRDAENLSGARNAIGTEAILCLLVAHGSREHVMKICNDWSLELATTYGVRASEQSSVQAARMYRYGREAAEPRVFHRTIAFALQ